METKEIPFPRRKEDFFDVFLGAYAQLSAAADMRMSASN